MLKKFKATLTGNQLQWLDEKPVSLTDEPTPIYIIYRSYALTKEEEPDLM